MAGLMAYLVGPGRHNEHTEPHLVAGDPALMAWYDDNQLGRADALAIARHLNRPQRAFGVEVPGGHVWHCSLSLSAEEGQLGDERWAQVVEAFVTKMGLDDAGGTKAPTRWVAVHHGLSKSGNDHVHIAVNLVREDGTKASTHKDWPRAQHACRELEAEHGLLRVEGPQRGRTSRGYHPAAREADARRRARAAFHQEAQQRGVRRDWSQLGSAEREARTAAHRMADQPLRVLERTVRACATASADEAEFVRRLRQHGLLVRGRLMEGTQDVVTGYSVAARPELGERPIWYGGGRLAHDLSLFRLRQEWPDTAQGASLAAAEWNAARRGWRPASVGREAHDPDPAMWDRVGRELEVLRENLRSVPADDHDTWARVARQVSGSFAAWSTRGGQSSSSLARTADVLARSAERVRSGGPEGAGKVCASGAALLLMSAAQGGRGAMAQAVMLRQLANLTKALYDMHRAEEDAHRAAEIERVVRRELAAVAAALPDPGPVGHPEQRAAEAIRTAWQAHAAPQRGPGSPIPNRIEPNRGVSGAGAASTRGGRPPEPARQGINR